LFLSNREKKRGKRKGRANPTNAPALLGRKEKKQGREREGVRLILSLAEKWGVRRGVTLIHPLIQGGEYQRKGKEASIITLKKFDILQSETKSGERLEKKMGEGTFLFNLYTRHGGKRKCKNVNLEMPGRAGKGKQGLGRRGEENHLCSSSRAGREKRGKGQRVTALVGLGKKEGTHSSEKKKNRGGKSGRTCAFVVKEKRGGKKDRQECIDSCH